MPSPAMTVLLVLHVSAGTIAIISGYGAVIVRKGGRLHRRLGTAFFASMLLMSLMGASLAVIFNQPGNIGGGILAFYLTATGWLAIRQTDQGVGRMQIGFMLIAVVLTGVLFTLGIQVSGKPRSHSSSTLYWVFAALAAVFALTDLSVVLRRGVTGPKRVSRHLWRMCLALFFASGSFFLGQQKVMPAWMQGSPALFVPALAPLILMVFWLGKVRLTSRPQCVAVRRGADPTRADLMLATSRD